MEPCKGLRPYEEQGKDNFFGREKEREILIDKVLSNKLTLLFAATGVGKSSLPQAAVLPELKRPDRENLDVIYYKDWVSNPQIALKKTVTEELWKQGKIGSEYPFDETLSLRNFFEACSIFTSEPLAVSGMKLIKRKSLPSAYASDPLRVF